MRIKAFCKRLPHARLPSGRYDPQIQGDGEDLQSLQDSMATRYPQILTSILQDEAYPAARTFLGLSLHSLQKFYSHSTWIEQGNTGILEDLGLPGFLYDDLADAAEDVCSACANPQVGHTSLFTVLCLSSA